jgi:hypothetical protein
MKTILWVVLIIITLLTYCLIADWWVTPPMREYSPPNKRLQTEMTQRGPLYLYVEDENGEVSYETEDGVCSFNLGRKK